MCRGVVPPRWGFLMKYRVAIVPYSQACTALRPWAAESRPVGALRNVRQRSPFLAPKGTDSIARGGALRAPGCRTHGRTKALKGRDKRRRLRTTIAERVPRRCPAPLGLFDEISCCDRPLFPGLRSAAPWAVESRPGWGFKKREQQRSPFLAPKGTDSIARGGALRSPGLPNAWTNESPERARQAAAFADHHWRTCAAASSRPVGAF